MDQHIIAEEFLVLTQGADPSEPNDTDQHHLTSLVYSRRNDRVSPSDTPKSLPGHSAKHYYIGLLDSADHTSAVSSTIVDTLSRDTGATFTVVLPAKGQTQLVTVPPNSADGAESQAEYNRKNISLIYDEISPSILEGVHREELKQMSQVPEGTRVSFMASSTFWNAQSRAEDMLKEYQGGAQHGFRARRPALEHAQATSSLSGVVAGE
ncbi:uncharacterized protein MKK02DRAFT_43198 [Dioszegia hungarica]|uniref:Uncharacterized protein n=1 Tax=Dioszegia hungarica TaxID=4972 RepID=A0AA38LVG5_9TREE|nr:uncharacterized protein MKK02DRAFT_43198 [Dioszegia hungarica]KAI9637275.1 hypothetical protein MKK02DRAFT_43198 [Dioszegia hungarica]